MGEALSIFMQTKIIVAILAAGKNKRMKTEVPKVMLPFAGKPLVAHVVESARRASVGDTVVLIVPPFHEIMRAYFGSSVMYAVQHEALGTGHAVMSAHKQLLHSEHIVVLYADMPFVRPLTIERLVREHVNSENTITLMTVTVPDFAGQFAMFSDFGRIIRDDKGNIEKIVEMKDASPMELSVRELNPAFFCFQTSWILRHLRFLKNNNNQGEYYLTDVVRLAIERGVKISSLDVHPFEAVGINTLKHLEAVHTLFGIPTNAQEGEDKVK